MSSHPYDGKILLVHWMGRTSPGPGIDDLAQLLRDCMPNVSGVMLKTSNGVSWQGNLSDEGPQAITGVRRVEEWVQTFANHGLDVHVWGVPRAKRRQPGETRSQDLEKEAALFAAAAKVPGVKSLLLDVEHGPYYWQGTPDEARELMTRIRDQVGAGVHIGMILDGRRNRPFEFHVDPWIPFVDSLHPMVYPVLFGIGNGRTVGHHFDEAFRNLTGYGKPIVPMLQAFAEAGLRPTQGQIVAQAEAAWARGAAGISFFRLGRDAWAEDGKPHMGDPEYQAIATITIPGREQAAPTYNWQNVINAAVIVALENNASWDQWMTDAGCWRAFHNSLREQPYNGPPIATWPIAPEHRLRIEQLAQLDPIVLARKTAEAQERAEPREKETTRATKRQPGAILGIHGAPGVAAPPAQHWDTWVNYLKEMGVRWYKQCDNGDPNDLGPHTIFAWTNRLKKEGIEPIVRFLMSEQFPDPLPDHYFQKMKRYAEQGIVWAEIGNEPNLDIEWKHPWRNQGNHQPMRHSNPDAIRIIADTWVRDARRTLETGMRPAFYAFAPTDWRGGYHPLYSSVHFTRNVVAYLAQHHRAATIDIFKRGGWIAVHTATYEQPFDFNPQRPDGTTWDMTLRGYEVVIQAFRQHFGADLDLGSIPIMSTEGGVFTPNSTSMTGHERLSTDAEHAQRVVGMFRWLEQHSPLQAMCPWCISVGSIIGHFHGPFQHDGWIEEINGQLHPRAVYEAMRQLRFDNQRRAERQDEAQTALRLDVPYISQFDDTARLHNADCGPTCLAMLLNAGRPLDQYATVDALYQEHLPDHQLNYTTVAQLMNIASDEGMPVERVAYANREEALKGAHTLLRAGKPFIALVNYDKWEDIARNNYRSGHYVVVAGFDDQHVYVHDPIFRGDRRGEGRFYVWRNERFLDGWGSGSEIGNPDFVALVPDKRAGTL